MSRWRAAPPSNWAPSPWDINAVSSTPFHSHPCYVPTSPRHYANLSMPSPTISTIDRQRPTLPVELYRIIVSHLTAQRDLCVLARVSKAFQPEAERALYHTIQLRQHIQTLWRCESLARQPRIAQYVRKLDIAVDQYTTLDSIARALASTVQLQSLTLQGAAWSDYSRVLDSVASLQIREFTCHSRGEAGVGRFLARQTQIEELDLRAQEFQFLSGDLPIRAVGALRVFSGWLTTAAKLVPGRPVRRLTLTTDAANEVAVMAIRRIADGSGEVAALDIRMGVLHNPVPWNIFEAVLQSLKGLRFLGVCSLECARHPSLPYYLMGLPHLQTIVFGAGTDDFTKYDEHVQMDMVRRLGDACDSLTRVIVSLPMWKNEWIWTRDPVPVTSFCYRSSNIRRDWWGVVSKDIDFASVAAMHVS